MGNAEIDGHVLACCNDHWRKVAVVVWQAAERANLHDKPWGHEAVAKRLRVLIRKRQIEAAGNIGKWRRSEVRLRKAKVGT